MGYWAESEGDRLIVSAERVQRDRDYIYIGDGYPTRIDLTNAFRYRVETKIRQSLEGYIITTEWWYLNLPEENPFRREGDYTFITEYHYFNIVNGEPVLAFLSC
jgi:hypothetical protein